MTKEQLLTKSLTAHALDENELISLLTTSCTDLSDPADLPTAAAEYVGQAYMIRGVHYRCEDKGSGVYEWESYDTSGQSLHYPDASGKPTLDGITLNGTLTKAALEIAPSAAARTAEADPSGMKIPLDDDKYIVYDDLSALLASAFDIANLPKYETYFNPLLVSDGTSVTWEITHTCKTSEPMVQIYKSDGFLQDYNSLDNLRVINSTGKLITITWKNVSNVAANDYYVVLVG